MSERPEWCLCEPGSFDDPRCRHDEMAALHAVIARREAYIVQLLAELRSTPGWDDRPFARIARGEPVQPPAAGRERGVLRRALRPRWPQSEVR